MIIGIILLVIAFVELLIGLMLIFRYQKSQATIFYGLFAISIAIYVGANGLGFAKVLADDNIAEAVAWVGGILTAVFIFGFSYSFPFPKKSLRELLPWIAWPMVVFIPGILFTESIIEKQEMIQFGQGYTTQVGQMFWLLIFVFAIYWIWGLSSLYKSFKTSSGHHRKFLKVLLIGIASALIVSSIFDIIYPLTTESSLGYIGSLFSSVWVIVTSYLILKK